MPIPLRLRQQSSSAVSGSAATAKQKVNHLFIKYNDDYYLPACCVVIVAVQTAVHEERETRVCFADQSVLKISRKSCTKNFKKSCTQGLRNFEGNRDQRNSFSRAKMPKFKIKSAC